MSKFIDELKKSLKENHLEEVQKKLENKHIRNKGLSCPFMAIGQVATAEQLFILENCFTQYTIPFVIQGAIEANNKELLEPIQDRVIEDWPEAVATGYARIGDSRKLLDLINTKPEDVRTRIIEAAILGAGQAGNIELISELQSFGINSRDIIFEITIYGLAQGGHFEMIDQACQMFDEDMDISVVAQGAAIGGHWNRVTQLVNEGAEIENVAYGYFKGGHYQQLEAAIHNGAQLSFFGSEPIDRQFIDIQTLSYISSDKKREVLTNEYSYLHLKNHLDYIKQINTFIVDHNCSFELAKKILDSNLSFVIVGMQMIRQGDYIEDFVLLIMTSVYDVNIKDAQKTLNICKTKVEDTLSIKENISHSFLPPPPQVNYDDDFDLYKEFNKIMGYDS